MNPTLSQFACVVYLASASLLAPAHAESVEKADPLEIRSVEDRVLTLPSDKRHTLWVAGDYEPSDGGVDVLVHFHGSPRVVRESTHSAGLNCVVISVNYGGLSSVYRRPFSKDRKLFQSILSEALIQLRSQSDFADDVKWRRVAVSSFSAGFGAVREILKTPRYFERVDGIYLVDSLYCGYVGDGTDQVETGLVHPGLMQDFVRYAQESANGEKVMIVTHCDGPTPGYASTRETADYLLEKLKLEPQSVDTIVPGRLPTQVDDFRLYRQASRKGFSLYGSPGGNETDHVKHLQHMDYWLPKLPLAKQQQDLAQ
ncbi:hypothetical protein [Adhaeretor mobilis]|uniref:Uncharacterized protein n=1 Tax=Adhaeretor mobilis TaxID=1930276 RepID=A0A517MV48_9BACT|nr:hypothetical protein [Adhaeretor mobilis]QDS98755.1 hypothetical protein HG15A2_20390 [Adhaeretor mobilis]